MKQFDILTDLITSKENIPRQITNIEPTRNAWGTTGRKSIAKQVGDGIATPYELEFDAGNAFYALHDQEDIKRAAAILASYKYTVDNHYMADIAAGFYTMVTKHQEGLCEVKEILTRDINGKEKLRGVQIVCSKATLYKAAFGPLVNKNGNAIDGAGNIIRDAKARIMPIIKGDKPMPKAYVSINQKGTRVVFSGSPINIYSRSISGDAMVIDLNPVFFPAELKKGMFTVKKNQEPYIHKVAGQTVFLQLGMRLANKEKRSPINIDTAVKIVTAGQAGFELGRFIKGIVKETKSDRINISIRRDAVKDLYPAAVDGGGYVRFKKFSEAVALTGQYFNEAIEHTGIRDKLLAIKNKKGERVILVPAEHKGAEFPKNLPGTCYLKVDRIN